MQRDPWIFRGPFDVWQVKIIPLFYRVRFSKYNISAVTAD